MIKANEKPKIIIIGGATASGKSDLAVELALKFNGEIIGADSMQIYRGLDIGTGKIRAEEMRGIRHRMIDILEPWELYSAGQYTVDAAKEIHQVVELGRLPIVVGGTGLYINALINNFTFAGARRDNDLRSQLIKEADEAGVFSLHEKLRALDAVSAAKIHSGDLKRIIRAIEIYYSSGHLKSESVDECNSPYNYLFLIVDTERVKLYSRIENRVDKMLENGLIDEVRALNLPLDCQSVKAIGYKETVEFLSGGMALDELAYKIKLNSRHYAKRQITYFKNIFPFAKWLPLDKDVFGERISQFLEKQ